MNIAPFVMTAFIVSGIALLVSFIAMSRVTNTLYAADRQRWIKAGRPCWFYWKPKGANRWDVGRGCSVASKWYFKTPSWIHDFPSAHRWLVAARSSLALFYAAIPITFAILVLLERFSR